MDNLFQTQTLCHKADPETSREAAQKMIDSGKLNKQERLVFHFIKSYLINHSDFIAKEISEWGEISYFTVQRRLSGLHRKGKIVRTGEKRDGCAVWRLR